MADPVDVAEVTQKLQSVKTFPKGQKVQKPGDNPNKLKAAGRKNYRPMTKTVIDGSNQEHATRVPFADPVLDRSPLVRGEIVVTDAEELAGTVDIRIQSIVDMGDLFASATIDFGDQTNNPELRDSAKGIIANMYLGAARNIYSAANSSVKSGLSPLKGVYYYEAPLPSTLSPVVSIYGDFESKLGKIGIRYTEQRFHQLVRTAVRVVEDTRDYAYDWVRGIVDEESTTVYDAHEWREFTQAIGSAAYQQTVEREYTAEIGTPVVPISIRPPKRRVGESDADYRARLAPIPAPDMNKNLLAMLEALRIGSEVTYAWLADNARAPLREAIGVRIAPRESHGVALARRFALTERKIVSKYLPKLSIMWEMSPTAATGKGFPAVTIHGQPTLDRFDTAATAPIPMSDGDFALGFMVIPANGVELNPALTLTNKEPRLRGMVSFMERSRRNYKD